jgi:hypothetical protein
MESVRTPAGPRQRLVLNLGLISLDKSAWKDLANAIESLLYNRPAFVVAKKTLFF